MRKLMIAAFASAALAACGQQSDAPGGAAGGGEMFPNLLGGSYRAEGTARQPDSGTEIQVVQYRGGGKMRMEMMTPAGQLITIMDPGAREAYSLSSAMGRKMAMKISYEEAETPGVNTEIDPASVTRVGPCSGAGESGTEWEHADSDSATRTCVTGDGVILRSTHNGAVVWETTKIERGPQDPALFAVPADYQVVDMNDLGAAIGQLKAARGQ